MAQYKLKPGYKLKEGYKMKENPDTLPYPTYPVKRKRYANKKEEIASKMKMA